MLILAAFPSFQWDRHANLLGQSVHSRKSRACRASDPRLRAHGTRNTCTIRRWETRTGSCGALRSQSQSSGIEKTGEFRTTLLRFGPGTPLLALSYWPRTAWSTLVSHPSLVMHVRWPACPLRCCPRLRRRSSPSECRGGSSSPMDQVVTRPPPCWRDWQVSEIACDLGSDITQLAKGPDGDLW